MKRKDLAEWEREYGGTTAEGIAKRVIKQYSPSSDELSRTVNRGRGAGKKADGATDGKEEASSDADWQSAGNRNENFSSDIPESEFLPLSPLVVLSEMNITSRLGLPSKGGSFLLLSIFTCFEPVLFLQSRS